MTRETQKPGIVFTAMGCLVSYALAVGIGIAISCVSKDSTPVKSGLVSATALMVLVLISKILRGALKPVAYSIVCTLSGGALIYFAAYRYALGDSAAASIVLIAIGALIAVGNGLDAVRSIRPEGAA
ncbi:hypothetical protein [Gordonia liuliyuniae]|uniref:Uncharacterized protein n=1 Tax=Gordonia liuliyuniae TaxID=2911517 RepID=A0ABS9ITF1_9ACTN|nr:hypothetical protein [Gordonia liuliyuniae]MCF8588828.1 hypothetical protein [Gordonia liuliyuniae]